MIMTDYKEPTYQIFIDEDMKTNALNSNGIIDFRSDNPAVVFQNAIDSAQGGKIFIKEGTYIFDNIDLHHNELYLQGEGDKTILKGNSSSDLISLSMPSGDIELNRVIIRDMRLESRYNTGGDVISSRNTLTPGEDMRINQFLFDNLFIYNVPKGKYGIALLNPDNAQISNCFVNLNEGGGGILLESNGHSSGAVRLYSNQVYTGGINTTGIYIKGTSSIRRIECFGYHWLGPETGTVGVKIEGICQMMNFIGCNFEDPKIAFDIMGAGTSFPWNPTQIIISGCHIFHRKNPVVTGQVGIQLDSNVSNCQVLGCYFQGLYGVTGSKGIVDNNTNLAPNIFENNEFEYIETPMTLTVSSKVRNNWGYKTENNVLSDTFAIDSTGVKTVTIAHGLAITPAVQGCYLTVVQDTAVDDWAYNLLKIVSTDNKNVIAKVNISIASATVGTTAKLALKVDNP